MEPTSSASQAANILSAVKEWPLWLFAAATISLVTILCIPVFDDLVTKETRLWIAVAAVAFGIFFACRFTSIVISDIKSYRASLEARHTFYLTPVAQQCHWGASRQPDGTIITQINITMTAKNRTDKTLHILTARLIRPRMSGETLNTILLIEDRLSHEIGSVHATGRHIPSGAVRSIVVNMLIRGVPKQKAEKVRPLAVLLSVADAEGNQQRVKLRLRPFDANATAFRD